MPTHPQKTANNPSQDPEDDEELGFIMDLLNVLVPQSVRAGLTGLATGENPLGQGIRGTVGAIEERARFPAPSPGQILEALSDMMSEPTGGMVREPPPRTGQLTPDTHPLPLSVRRAITPREGTPLATAFNFLTGGGLNPADLAGGPLLGGGRRGAQAAQRVTSGTRTARTAQTAPEEVAQVRIRTVQGKDIVTPGDPNILRSAHSSGRGVEIDMSGLIVGNPTNPRYLPQNSPQVRRAKQAGYETEAFHATDASEVFEGVPGRGTGQETIHPWSHFGSPRAAMDRLDARAQRMGAGEMQGHVVIDEFDPFMGSTRSIGRAVPEGGRTMPVMIRGRLLNATDSEANSINGVLRAAQREGVITTSERGMLSSAGGLSDHDAWRKLVGDFLRDKGISGVRYANQGEDIGSMAYMVFDPGDVRALSAQFDPARAGEAGLMLGFGAVGATGLAAQQQEGTEEQ